MSAKKGINTFGEKAVVAIVEEYWQLDTLGVFEPITYDQLNKTQKSEVLNAIDLIKQKRCGKIKGRTVADGRKQRELYAKLETSSPTLSLEAFTTSLMMDAAEGRSIAIADVAGAFLKVDMEDFVVVKLQGPAVEALVEINKKKYHRYITKKGSTKVLYVRPLKAMYGTLKEPILWYSLFANTLKENGYTIYPYNNCVANKEINGKQFTICWYVDDIKFSHVDETVVKEEIKKIEQKFDKMTILHGKRYTYLGMNFEIKSNTIKIGKWQSTWKTASEISQKIVT